MPVGSSVFSIRLCSVSSEFFSSGIDVLFYLMGPAPRVVVFSFLFGFPPSGGFR